jgi:hypothetical protein
MQARSIEVCVLLHIFLFEDAASLLDISRAFSAVKE